ncbi:type I restriction-modification system subunit M [bacterium]|nr:type I restriction-modification system subunit M [bacterium]
MTPEEFKRLEDNLWAAADNMRANSDLKSSEYAVPVLGLIFLKFADNKYTQFEDEILQTYNELKGTRREKPISEIAIEKCGFYLPDKARYNYLLNLPENEDIDKALKEAMADIEKYKPELAGVLPQEEYFKLTRTDKQIPKDLLKNFADIPKDATGDMFGKIYEYFLGKFALAEGQGGGEFFTPNSVVRLMVEIIQPHNGTVFDPACGSGGMFVQSAQFIHRRKERNGNGDDNELFVYGQEKTLETVKLAKMNLAVNGLRGDVRQANTYYEDVHKSFEAFDYVLANPPFNVDDVTLGKVEADRRFNTYGVPRNKSKTKNKGEETCPNANYLWINLFATSLKSTGRAALVMANSASDARHSEAEIRQNLIENNLIYGMLTLPSNMFYTVTLPATLWFFDKAKTDNRILFIDARNVFTQVDRAHREFNAEQIRNIAIISKLHRGDRVAFIELIDDYFKQGMAQFAENKEIIETLAFRIKTYLQQSTENHIPDLAAKLRDITTLESRYQSYLGKFNTDNIEAANAAQQELLATFAPFFTELHEMLKTIDKKVRNHEKEHKDAKETKALKAELEELHKDIKSAEQFFVHIQWLQERFPSAAYEDVTGLCKLATLDEVKEQDYSLNPGRYVGVVIEEDGKTEDEFIEEILLMNDELEKLNAGARELETVIGQNIRLVAGEDQQ